MTENYSFSTDWTDPHTNLWKHFIPKDISSVLEIGNWEGRSTIWFADYFDQAQITSIDPSQWGARHSLLSNISKSPNVSRIKLIFEKSEDAMYVDNSVKNRNSNTSSQEEPIADVYDEDLLELLVGT